MSERRVRLESRYYVRRPQAEPEDESRLMLGLAVIGEVLGCLGIIVGIVGAILIVAALQVPK